MLHRITAHVAKLARRSHTDLEAIVALQEASDTVSPLQMPAPIEATRFSIIMEPRIKPAFAAALPLVNVSAGILKF